MDNRDRLLAALTADHDRMNALLGLDVAEELQHPRLAQRPRVGYSVRGAGLGVLVARRIPPDTELREAYYAWKRDPATHPLLATMLCDMVRLLRQWQEDRIPADWVVTTPPPGSSDPACYPAEILAESVAACFDLEYRPLLTRTETDKRPTHHPMASLEGIDPSTTHATEGLLGRCVLCVDDFISSGRTLAHSLRALREAGATAFGFGWASK